MLEKIICLIEARGLVQGDLEERAGLSENRISKWRNTSRVTHPRFDEVAALARVLGVSLDWLASDLPDELPPPATDAEVRARDIIERIGWDATYARLIGAPEPTGPWKPVRGYVVPERSGENPGALDAGVANGNDRPTRRR